jgi:hypothetical protein
MANKYDAGVFSALETTLAKSNNIKPRNKHGHKYDMIFSYASEDVLDVQLFCNLAQSMGFAVYALNSGKTDWRAEYATAVEQTHRFVQYKTPTYERKLKEGSEALKFENELYNNRVALRDAQKELKGVKQTVVNTMAKSKEKMMQFIKEWHDFKEYSQ